MLIKNYTKWDTSDLKKLFSRCIQEVRKIEGEGKNKGIKIELKNDNIRKYSIRGRAYIGYYKMMLKIGTEVDLTKIEKQEELAHLFIHEYYHNLGTRSQDYKHYTRDFTKRFDYSFTKNYQIGIEKIKPKPKRDLQMERYQRVLGYVKLYQTKTKRVQTLLRKWKQKKKYYEGVLVASGKIKPE